MRLTTQQQPLLPTSPPPPVLGINSMPATPLSGPHRIRRRLPNTCSRFSLNPPTPPHCHRLHRSLDVSRELPGREDAARIAQRLGLLFASRERQGPRRRQASVASVWQRGLRFEKGRRLALCGLGCRRFRFGRHVHTCEHGGRVSLVVGRDGDSLVDCVVAVSDARGRRGVAGLGCVVIVKVGLGLGVGEGAGGCEDVKIVVVRGKRGLGAHRHGARGGREEGCVFGRHVERFVGHDGTVIEEGAGVRVGERVGIAAGLGCRTGAGLRVPGMMGRKVRGKVLDERVERLCAEELEGVLPLLGSDKVRVADNLECCRLERIVQLAEPLLLAVLEEAVEVISGAGLVGDLVNIVVEGLRVLNGRRDGVVLIMQLGEEVVSPQAKLPMWPAPARIRQVVHLWCRGVGGVRCESSGWWCGCLIERERERIWKVGIFCCYRTVDGIVIHSGVWRSVGGGQVENRLLGAGEVAGNVSCVPAGGAGGHLGTGFDEEHFERYRGKSFGGLGGFKK